MPRSNELELIAGRLKEIVDALAGAGIGPVGPQGATGATGATGAAGATLLTGSGAPLAANGQDGDYYLDTGSAPTVLYGPKASGLWGSGTTIGITALSKSLTLESPGAAEDVTMFYTEDDITITAMRAVCRGTTPSVAWTIRKNTNRNAIGQEVVTGGTTTTSTTTADDVTSFNAPAIPKGRWVWLETTATAGTVAEFTVSLEFEYDQ